jgi:flagellar biosynthesis protein
MTSPRSGYRRAVGLQYEDAQGETPLVAIKGDLREAEEVVRIARRFGIPIVENGSLARALSAVEVDARIPPSLFHAVALVLAHVDGASSPR